MRCVGLLDCYLRHSDGFVIQLIAGSLITLNLSGFEIGLSGLDLFLDDGDFTPGSIYLGI